MLAMFAQLVDVVRCCLFSAGLGSSSSEKTFRDYGVDSIAQLAALSNVNHPLRSVIRVNNSIQKFIDLATAAVQFLTHRHINFVNQHQFELTEIEGGHRIKLHESNERMEANGEMR